MPDSGFPGLGEGGPSQDKVPPTPSGHCHWCVLCERWERASGRCARPPLTAEEARQAVRACAATGSARQRAASTSEPERGARAGFEDVGGCAGTRKQGRTPGLALPPSPPGLYLLRTQQLSVGATPPPRSGRAPPTGLRPPHNAMVPGQCWASQTAREPWPVLVTGTGRAAPHRPSRPGRDTSAPVSGGVWPRGPMRPTAFQGEPCSDLQEALGTCESRWGEGQRDRGAASPAPQWDGPCLTPLCPPGQTPHTCPGGQGSFHAPVIAGAAALTGAAVRSRRA